MTPQASDLAALQQVLDRVDSRLTRDLPPAPRLSLVTRGRTILVSVGALVVVQFLLSLVALNGAGLGGDPFSQPIAIAGVLVVIACAGMGFAWLRRRTGAGLRWSVAAIGIFGVIAVLTVMADLGRATALNRDLVIAPAVEAHVLDAAPAAVFDLPVDAQTIRLSPHGRLVALVRRGATPGDARANRVFTIAGARGVVADIPAEDVAFLDDTHIIALTMRNGIGEVSTVDVASGTHDWRQRLADIRSGTLTYRSAVNAWIVFGRDDSGQLLRMAGTVGASDFTTLTWPAPADAGDIDAWAATVAGTVAVQNHTDGRTFARIWIAPRSGNPIATVMPNTTCAVDVAIDRRLLCAMQAGTATRIFAVDGDTGAWTALASIDGAFRPGEQTASGWLTGSWRGTPAALRLATRDLVVAGPAIDDEAPSLLTVSQTMIATVSSSAGGSRVRVFRRVP
jgi:hypothetical protein